MDEAEQLYQEGLRLMPAWNAPPDAEARSRALAPIERAAELGHYLAMRTLVGASPDHAVKYRWAVALAKAGDGSRLVSLLTDGATPVEVRTADDLAEVACLAIPGGESTTIGKLARAYDLVDPVRRRAEDGMPILGTCAGMIVLAREVIGGDPLFALMDIAVHRNAYGRQVDSFETDVAVDGLDHRVRGVFIRAPVVERSRMTAR